MLCLEFWEYAKYAFIKHTKKQLQWIQISVTITNSIGQIAMVITKNI